MSRILTRFNPKARRFTRRVTSLFIVIPANAGIQICRVGFTPPIPPNFAVVNERSLGRIKEIIYCYEFIYGGSGEKDALLYADD